MKMRMRMTSKDTVTNSILRVQKLLKRESTNTLINKPTSKLLRPTTNIKICQFNHRTTKAQTVRNRNKRGIKNNNNSSSSKIKKDHLDSQSKPIVDCKWGKKKVGKHNARNYRRTMLS
jgi:hypothetical protein